MQWARSLGGVSFPLLQDFEPKGALAKALGVYLDGPGITDRATVLIDREGTVRWVESVGPGGKRDMNALLAEAKKLGGDGSAFPAAGSLPAGTELFVKHPCGASEQARAAVTNLHLDAVPVHNVSEDQAQRARLEDIAGKHQAPCLMMDGQPMFEATDIVKALAERIAPLPGS
jgi:glutaredoxin-related protein